MSNRGSFRTARDVTLPWTPEPERSLRRFFVAFRGLDAPLAGFLRRGRGFVSHIEIDRALSAYLLTAERRRVVAGDQVVSIGRQVVSIGRQVVSIGSQV